MRRCSSQCTEDAVISHNSHDLRTHESLPARASLVIAFAISMLVLSTAASICAQDSAPTPPMGWSEWDSYGLTITEKDFKANAAVLAGLRRYGWQYAMLDAGWYEDNPISTHA